MVAVCDILGFADHVRTHPLDEVIDVSLAWFAKALAHSLDKDGFPDTPPDTSVLRKHPLVGCEWFSDTVLLWSREDTDEHCRALCQTVAWLLFETMFRPDVRLRCGLAYGEAHIDPAKAIYVGKPIVDAHEMERAQVWAGGAFTESAVDRVPPAARTGTAFDWFVVPYAIPLQTSNLTSGLAVDWTKGSHHDFRLPWSPQSDEPTQSDWAKDRKVCEKWSNTVEFHREVCFWCKRKDGTGVRSSLHGSNGVD